MTLLLMNWLMQWLIVLIPVFQITSYKKVDEKCKNRWGLADFIIPLLLKFLSGFIATALTAIWIWFIAAWGIYFYFLYSVKYKGICPLSDIEENK